MRRVNLKLLNEWIEANGPDGVTKLAYTSEVSASLIHKMRSGRVPIRSPHRLKVCRAMKVEHDALFPDDEPLAGGESQEEAG